MTLSELNKQFSLNEHLTFINGKGGLPFIHIKNIKAQALISLYGGQVLEFCPTTEQHDILFLSTQAHYEKGKAIRGGIPICWPWFGVHPQAPALPKHGFARNRLWSVLSTHAETDELTSIKLKLQSTEETLQLWPHAFELELVIAVTDSLSLELITRNTGNSEFTLSQALHGYFQVASIAKTQLLGLEQTQYFDKLANNSTQTQKSVVRIDEEVDRVYIINDSELILEETALKRQIKLSMSGADSCVVWNPWQEASAKLDDLNTDDYQTFICVEAGNIVNHLCIQPGSTYSLHYKIR